MANNKKHLKEMNLRFSVIIPLYNKEFSIEKTLNAIINQSYSNFEIIVVDDGSTDNSASIVNNCKDSRVKLFQKKNEGVSIARNYGILKSSGEYLAFCDADDIWLENHLEVLNKLGVDFSECTLLGTSFIISRDGHNIPFKTSIPYGIIDNYFYYGTKQKTVVWTSTAAIKRSTAIKNNYIFPPGIKSGEDLYLWITIAKKHKVAYSPQETVIYNLEPNHSWHYSINPPYFFYSLRDPKIKFLNNYLSFLGLREAFRYAKCGFKKEALLGLSIYGRNLHDWKLKISILTLILTPFFLFKKIINCKLIYRFLKKKTV